MDGEINSSINVVINIYHGPGGGQRRGGQPEWVGEPESAHLDGEIDVVDGRVELGEAGLPLRDGGVSGDGLEWSIGSSEILVDNGELSLGGIIVILKHS